MFKFREDFYSRVFNFAIFLQNLRNWRRAKLSINKVFAVGSYSQKSHLQKGTGQSMQCRVSLLAKNLMDKKYVFTVKNSKKY